MNPHPANNTSRRAFLQSTGRIVAASALAGVAIPHVHAAEDNTICLALIGCGGRGSGAVADAMVPQNGPVKLVAMADAFADRLNSSYLSLKKQLEDRVDVPEDRKFVGLDAYKQAIDCLKPGDIAIFACPAGFRCVQLGYAIEKGIHAFMEKPITTDGATTRKMFELGEQASKKNLKVAVGLMTRHCRASQALYQRIRDGEIGEIVSMQSCRQHGPVVGYHGPKPQGMSEVEFQVRRFHAFLWASGGTYSDFYIHFIDECCWLKDAWPISAKANGGRHFRGDCVDQNFDNYSVDYTFGDGTKLHFYGRAINGCHEESSSYAFGTKGLGMLCHMPGGWRTYRGYNLDKNNLLWTFPQHTEPNPYHMEWIDLIDAVRQDKPCNEVKRGAEASLVTSMGRMAAHTGKIITYDQMLESQHEFAPEVERLALDGPAPLLPGPDGRYPVPQPGITTDREY